MKKLFYLLLLVTSASVAQVAPKSTITDKLIANDTIKLKNIGIGEISTDINLSDNSDKKITTQKAIKSYVDNTAALKLDFSKQSIVTSVAGLRTLFNIQTDVPYVTYDNGGGTWYYDPTDLTSADNTGTVIVNGTKRLKRNFSGPYDVRWFGAIPNGVTECSTIIQNMINAGITSIYLPSISGSPGYLINNTVTITSGVTIAGDEYGTSIITDINDHRPVFTTNGAYASRHVIKDLHIIGHGGKKNFIGIWDKTPRFTYDNIIVEQCGLGMKFDNTWLGSVKSCMVFNADTGWTGNQLNGVAVKIDVEICQMNFYLINSTGVDFQANVNEGNDALNPKSAIIDNSTNITGNLYFEGGYNYPVSHLVVGPTGYVIGLNLGISAVGAAIGQYPITLDRVNQCVITGYAGAGDSSRTALKLTTNVLGYENKVVHSGFHGSTFTDGSGRMGRRVNYFPNPKFDNWLSGWASITTAGIPLTLTKENTIVRKVGNNAVRLSPTTPGTTGYGLVSFNIGTPNIEKLRGRKLTMMTWVYVPNISEFSNPPHTGATNNVLTYISSYNGTTSVVGSSESSFMYIKGEWALLTSTVTVQSDAVSVGATYSMLGAGYTNTGNEYIVIGECYFVDGDADENILLNSKLIDAPTAMSHFGGQLVMSGTSYPTSPLMYFNVGDKCYNSNTTATGADLGWVCTTAGQGGTATWLTMGKIGASGSPILNQTALQTGSNFNIDGIGKATGGGFEFWETNAISRRRMSMSMDSINGFAVFNATFGAIGSTPGVKFQIGNVDKFVISSTGAISFANTGGTNHVLKQSTAGGVITSAALTGAELQLNDVITNNASTSNHGFLPKLPGTTSTLLDGTGSFITPTLTGAGSTIVSGTFPNYTITSTSGSGNMGIGNLITGAVANPFLYAGTNGTLQPGSSTRGWQYDSVNNNLLHKYDNTHYGTYGVDASGNITISSTGTTLTINPSLTINNSLSVGTLGTGNLGVATTATNTTVSDYQIEGATTTGYKILFGGSTNPTITAGTSYFPFIFRKQLITEGSTGTYPALGVLALRAPVITDGGASTLLAPTFYVEGAPTGITATNGNWSAYIKSGPSYFGGTVQGVPATASNQLVTRQQVTDSLQTVRLQTGSTFLSGDGSTTTFDISLPVTPTWSITQLASDIGTSISSSNFITNGIRIRFVSAPPVGANNIAISYSYK